MTNLRLAIFDMDGTLMDSQASILGAMASAYKTAGHAAPTADAIRGIIGLSLVEAVQHLTPSFDVSEASRVAEFYKQHFVEARARNAAESAAPLYDGALNALMALKQDPEVLLGVATGKARRGLEHALKTHDLGAYFVTTQSADEHPSKPNPSMIDQCLRDTGVDVDNTVMIGDTTFDISMGVAAGVKTIGVSWGYHSVDALKTAGADVVIDHYDALVPALNELWGQ